MNPEVVSVEPGRRPTCGMKLLPIASVPAALELLEAGGTAGDQVDGHAAADSHAAGGIEWEDTMKEVNRQSNPALVTQVAILYVAVRLRTEPVPA
jgi:hypothetical protein